VVRRSAVTALALYALLNCLGSVPALGAEGRLADEAAQGRWLFTPGRITLGIHGGGGFSMAGGQRDAELAMLAGRVGYVVAQQERMLPGSLEVVGEPFYLAVFQDKTAHVGGFSALVKYNIWTGTRFVPFVEGGGGVSYASDDVPPKSSHFNFTAQVGAGLHYVVGERSTIDFRGIFHHLSNANTADDNPGLNNALFFVGMTFLY
jgi:hypothetical protein